MKLHYAAAILLAIAGVRRPTRCVSGATKKRQRPFRQASIPRWDARAATAISKVFPTRIR